MFKLYLKTLYDNRWIFISLLCFAVFFVWIYVSIFKSIAFVATIEEMVKILPEKIIKSMNIEIGSLNTLEGFIGNEKFAVIVTLMTTVLGISLGGSYLSGEIDKGTIYLPLSLPFKRTKFYLTKLFAGATTMIAFSGIFILSVFPLSWAYGVSLHSDRFLKFSLICTLLGLAIFSFSLFLSSMFSEKSKVAFTTGSVIIIMYVLNIVSGIKDNFEFLRYFSVFHYFDVVDILVRSNVKPGSYLVLLGFFLLFSTLGYFWFQRRDIFTGD